MDFITHESITILKSDFQDSYQLLWNENSGSERINITEVHVYPGKTNNRHSHEHSEQIWIAISGIGTLLLGDGQTKKFNKGDVVRFAENEIHGIQNDMEVEFIYISVTSPPINFRYAYKPME